MDHASFDSMIIDVSVCLMADQVLVTMFSTTTSYHLFLVTSIRARSFIMRARFFGPHCTHIFSKIATFPRNHKRGIGKHMGRSCLGDRYEFPSERPFPLSELGSAIAQQDPHFLTIMYCISHFHWDTMQFKNLRECVNHSTS